MANERVGLFPDVLGREQEGQEGRRWFWEVREASSQAMGCHFLHKVMAAGPLTPTICICVPSEPGL